MLVGHLFLIASWDKKIRQPNLKKIAAFSLQYAQEKEQACNNMHKRKNRQGTKQVTHLYALAITISFFSS
jgi:hypothetical protein